MGEYSRIELRTRLRDDMPVDVSSTLRDMTAMYVPDFEVPGLPFSSWLLQGESAYHPKGTTSLARDEDSRLFLVDSASVNHGRGIDAFVEWLAPWTDSAGSIAGFVEHGSNEWPRSVAILVGTERGIESVEWRESLDDRWGSRPAEPVATFEARPGAVGDDLLRDPSVAEALAVSRTGGERDREAALSHLMELVHRSGVFADETNPVLEGRPEPLSIGLS